MINGKISQIKNKNGEVSFPVTTSKAVYMQDGTTTVEKKFEEVNSSLETKANVVDVRKKDISIDLDDLSERTILAIEGGEGASFELSSVPRNNSVNYGKLDSLMSDNFTYTTEKVDLVVKRGSFWDMSKNGVLTSIETQAYGSCSALSVNSGDMFIVSGRSVWTANIYIIKDANDNILSVYPNKNETGKNYDNITFVIPDKGTKLCLNSWLDYPTVLEKINNVDINYNKINKLKDDIVKYKNLNDDIKDIFNLEYKNVDLNFDVGGYYKYSTMELIEHNDFQNTKLVCEGNVKYKISGATSYESNLYILQDFAGNKISVFPNISESGKVYKDIEFTTPTSGCNILINQRLSVSETKLEILKPTVNDRSKQTGINWCAFGDSLTDSATLGVYNYNYTNFVANDLELSLTNCGKGGTGYLANNNGASLPFYQRVNTIPVDTDLLTIFGSFNDMFVSGYTLGTINDTGVDTVYGAIKKMVTDSFKVNDKIKVALITPTPWSGRWRGHSTNGENVVKYVQAIIDVANYYSIPCLNLFDCSNLRPWDNTFNGKYYLNSDGTHPNTEGHKYISPKIEDFVKSIIRNY